MVNNPIDYVERMADAGVDYLSFHTDSTPFVIRTIDRIRTNGMKPGVVLNPSARVDTLQPYANLVDMVTLMAVEPGFAGQKFMMSTVERVAQTAALRKQIGCDFLINVDGAMTYEGLTPCIQRGANVIVTGIFTVFQQPDGIVSACKRFNQTCEDAMAAGFIGFGIGTWWASYITKDWDFYELLLPQILRGCSLMLCMIPINNIALGTLPPARMKNASGLFNLTRNLGGAVGLALINTILNDRWDLHLTRLHERFTWANTAALERLDTLQRGFDSYGSAAPGMALQAMTNTVRIQGLVMAFEDVFLALTALFLAIACAVPLIRRPNAVAGGGGGH